MTQERTAANQKHLSTFYPPLQSHTLSIDLTAEPKSASPPRSTLNPQNRSARDYRWQRECRRGLELALERLSEKDPVGKDHIEAYLREQYRRHLRPGTLEHTLRCIEGFMFLIQRRDKIHVEQVSRQEIEAWVEYEQDRGMKASTVKMRLGVLKAFLRFLIERDILAPELLSKRMIIKVPDALPGAMDPDDVRQLLAVLEAVRNRAMILILLRTGMRVGELLNTIMEDVNLKERRIEIYEASKTRVGRVVYLSDDALKALKAWLKVRAPDGAYLFYCRGKHRQRMNYAAVRELFRKLLEKAGLSHKGYTLHCLRHTCATELLNAGMRLECVQQLLGHRTIEMTRRYARLTDRTREKEYFTAMAIIERGEISGHYQLDRQLPAFFEKTQLLRSHDQELHEHP
jgi:integrase/recombinase XerD